MVRGGSKKVVFDMSSQTVRNYWRSWYTSGIVSVSKKFKGGGRFEKVFNLEDLGIPLPKQVMVPMKQEQGTAASTSEQP